MSTEPLTRGDGAAAWGAAVPGACSLWSEEPTSVQATGANIEPC